MKPLSILFVVTFTYIAFGNRTYHPHISEVSVSFQSGDQVTFQTEKNTASVTSITIKSRKGFEYKVPEKEIKEIKAPKLDTLKITFHENSNQPYKEGSFVLFFDHDGSSESPGFTPDAEFFFEEGIYVGGFDDWSSYRSKKEKTEKHNKAVDTTAANARLFDDVTSKSTNPDLEAMTEAAVVSP